MPITFTKDFYLSTFDTDVAVRIEGVWRHVKAFYDMDAIHDGRNSCVIFHFGNGYIKASYPDFVTFTNPTDEHINRIICEYNIDELSNEWNRRKQEVRDAEERRQYLAKINEIANGMVGRRNTRTTIEEFLTQMPGVYQD